MILADLDGVVYAGAGALPHAVESLNAARDGRRIGYITNNASRTDASVAAHLSELGLPTRPEEVVTSPQAAMRLLAQKIPAGSTVLIVGGDGLVVEAEKAGFVVTRSADDAPAAVVQGFSPDLGWNDLAEAAFALSSPRRGGIPWIATNTDWTIPRRAASLRATAPSSRRCTPAVGRLPIVAGKPETPLFEKAVERFAAERPLFVGDRLDTDIQGANARRHAVRARAHRDRPAQAHPRGAGRLAADVHPGRSARAVAALSRGRGARRRASPCAVRACASRSRRADPQRGGRPDRPAPRGRAGDLGLRRAIFGFRVPERLADPFRRP